MKRVYFFSGLGFIIAFLLVFTARTVFLEDQTVHYHANFALYINEKQDKFGDPLFYDEVQSCSSEDLNNPKHRVHLHGNESHVVHTHDNGVTWGHFFANLGYGLTNDSITTKDGTFVDGRDGKKLTFFLNRQPVQSIANTVIKSEDTLLVDYGNENEIDAKFSRISQDSGQYNTRQDPASCSGNELSADDRMLRVLKFWE